MNEQLPAPIVNADSRAYWEGARENRLMVRLCRACGKRHFLPRYLCPQCWSDDLEWTQCSGRGTVHTFTVIRRAPMAAFAPRVPYVVALVDLEEGPRMMANIVGDDALDTKIGDAVSAVYEERGGDGAKVVQFKRSGAT